MRKKTTLWVFKAGRRTNSFKLFTTNSCFSKPLRNCSWRTNPTPPEKQSSRFSYFLQSLFHVFNKLREVRVGQAQPDDGVQLCGRGDLCSLIGQRQLVMCILGYQRLEEKLCGHNRREKKKKKKKNGNNNNKHNPCFFLGKFNSLCLIFLFAQMQRFCVQRVLVWKELNRTQGRWQTSGSRSNAAPTNSTSNPHGKVFVQNATRGRHLEAHLREFWNWNDATEFLGSRNATPTRRTFCGLKQKRKFTQSVTARRPPMKFVARLISALESFRHKRASSMPWTKRSGINTDCFQPQKRNHWSVTHFFSQHNCALGAMAVFLTILSQFLQLASVSDKCMGGCSLWRFPAYLHTLAWILHGSHWCWVEAFRHWTSFSWDRSWSKYLLLGCDGHVEPEEGDALVARFLAALSQPAAERNAEAPLHRGL